MSISLQVRTSIPTSHWLVCPCISPPQHALELLVRPGIKVDRLDPTDMRSHATMNARTSGKQWVLVVTSIDMESSTLCKQRPRDSNSPIVDLFVKATVSFCSSRFPCLPGAIGLKNTRLFLLQSAQLLFPSSFSKLLIVCWFCAAGSAAGFAALLDMLHGLTTLTVKSWSMKLFLVLLVRWIMIKKRTSDQHTTLVLNILLTRVWRSEYQQ